MVPGSAPPASTLAVSTCSSTPEVGPRPLSATARGITVTASTAAATTPTAAASQRRLTSAIRAGSQTAAATYGVNANSCTSSPRSQPKNRMTDQAIPGSTISHTSTVTARRLAGRATAAGGELVMVMSATLSGRRQHYRS
jgi:hypothetical protein